MVSSVSFITSRDNPQVKLLRRLAQDNTAYRQQSRVWLEGDHLCRAALARGRSPVLAVFTEAAWEKTGGHWEPVLSALPEAVSILVLPQGVMASLSGLESPADMAFVVPLSTAGGAIEAVRPGQSAVVLDRVQDAGNVGSILRSASAFGFTQVLALKGTAALWSPKVVRAGMGAHFGLHLVEGLSIDDLAKLNLPVLVTSSHGGAWVQDRRWPWPCAWAFGHEGQGVSDALIAQAHEKVQIAQPGGEESLNVAAAAAICLYASVVSRPE
jgi:TrmH family RNA methyltransferase